MGFLKDLSKLHQQAKELDKTFDPGAQMQEGQRAMEAASLVMEQQTAAATVEATGDPGHRPGESGP
jgi:hypothetical protein